MQSTTQEITKEFRLGRNGKVLLLEAVQHHLQKGVDGVETLNPIFRKLDMCGATGRLSSDDAQLIVKASDTFLLALKQMAETDPTAISKGKLEMLQALRDGLHNLYSTDGK